MKGVSGKRSVTIKRALPPAMRMDIETKTIEKKLEELKSSMKSRNGEKLSKLDKPEASNTNLIKGRVLEVSERIPRLNKQE